MPRPSRSVPARHSFHITLHCNSRQFLIAKRIRRDVLLVVLEKAKQKYPFRLYDVYLMANHIPLLLKPQDAIQLPKLMHWVGWYASMLLNRLSGRCGHFWEVRYCITPLPLPQKTTKGRSIPCVNYGHYSRLETDGIILASCLSATCTHAHWVRQAL